MVSAVDVKFRLSGGASNTTKSASVGGVISTAAGGVILTATPLNLFLGIPANDTVLGKVYYRCIYVKNEHATETMKECSFFMQSNTPNNDTSVDWALGTSPINGTEQGPFSDQNTSPANVTWIGIQNSAPTIANIGDLKAGEYKSIWIRLTLNANSSDYKNDNAVFLFRAKVVTGGSSTGGSGEGGTDISVDDFGIRKIYPTLSGGRTYNSNWHTATSHQWDSAAQTYGQLDPQDSMADLVSPSTCRAIVDSTTKTLQADTNSDRNSWRYYIKDPADTETSSTWKWSESTEITVYYKAISDFEGGSIHVHCRIMGPTEHWLAISHCGAAGHEYSYEIKKNGVNQFRKEEVHVGGDAGGYADNIEFPDTNAPYNTWIGMKLTTQLQSGKMKIQAWKDTTDGFNGGTWVKAGEIIDDGTNWTLPEGEAVDNYNGLPAGSGNCTKISPIDCALTMDCSAVGLRVDNTKVQFKKFSVREIDPTSTGSGGSGGGTTGGGGTTPPTPPPPTPDAFNFVSTGDWDANSMTKKVVASMEAENPEFCVDLGDHAYTASQSSWLSVLKSLKDKMIATVGNHDSTNTVKSQFGYSSIPYSVTKQNVHFLVLNTETSMSSGSSQYNFVLEDLKKAKNDANVDWIVVSMHKPFYTADSDHGPNENGQVDAFAQMFDTYKVDLVLTGHIHNIQRTFPVVYNPASKLNPTVADDGPGPYTKGEGRIYIICGGGGHDSGSALYPIDSDEAFNAYADDNNNGYVNVAFSGVNNSVMTVTIKNQNGDPLDTFVVQ